MTETLRKTTMYSAVVNFLFLFLTLLLLPAPHVTSFGIGRPASLYNQDDRGIVILETGNFTANVVGAETALLVEFYSSYCGHCINFAPHFKEFAANVADWKSVIKVAVIDCAQDVNVEICREYEIMGYPSLKFFPPRATKTDLGFLRKSYSKEIHDLISDMLDYLQQLEGNDTMTNLVQQWPKLLPLRIGSLDEIWTSADEKAALAIVTLEESTSLLGRQLAMDMYDKVRQLPTPIVMRRAVTDTEAGHSLLRQLNVPTNFVHFPLVVAVDRQNTVVETLWKGGEATRPQMSKVVGNFIWSKSKELSGSAAGSAERPKKKLADKSPNSADDLSQTAVTKESEIKRRRYTAFMSDLENSILYALSHEVSQRAIISDKSLAALHSYLDVLVKYFPGRKRTIQFLDELRVFVRSHDDVIRGQDLQEKVTQLRLETKAFSDLDSDWIGCRGSKPMYGGYPCSVWTLWHTLTVAQLNKEHEEEDPKEVLEAMVGYIDNFFGCRECARHFLLEVEDGQAVEREVKSPEMSVLLLWKIHNKANRRLSGDLTDDRAFPKEIFPNSQHCSQCYDEAHLGSDLWSEFQRDTVLDFLKDLYKADSLSMANLSLEVGGLHVGRNSDSHDLILADEKSDKSNFSELENRKNSWGLTFSSTDITLCFGIYVLSAIILIVVYLKFVAKKKFSSLCSGVFGRRRSSNYPMV